MLHEFYPVLPDSLWLRRLVPCGVKCVQLRLKDAEPSEVRRQIAESLAICSAHGCLLIVNDYWRDAIDLGAQWIHLGQEDLAAADMPAIRKAGLKVGISTHDRSELEIALNAGADYVALGPIYETRLKKMKWSPQGLDRLREWKSLVDCPLVAIGGLTVECAQGALDAGADSLAVVTDLVTHPYPEHRVEQWLAVVS
ncbi:MAG: thiamine phosphate synthase [Pseudomonadota bacterium]|nr:thiamine phosphate synthase [Pseudomonadota bacterium]